LYTSDIDRAEARRKKETEEREGARTARGYLLVSLAVALFGAVYEHFSYEVYSGYMLYAWAIPMLLGTLPAVLRASRGRGPLLSVTGRKLWRAGIAVLTVGALYTGVLAIYGTSAVWSYVYGVAGAILLFAGGLIGSVGGRAKRTA